MALSTTLISAITEKLSEQGFSVSGVREFAYLNDVIVDMTYHNQDAPRTESLDRLCLAYINILESTERADHTRVILGCPEYNLFTPILEFTDYYSRKTKKKKLPNSIALEEVALIREKYRERLTPYWDRMASYWSAWRTGVRTNDEASSVPEEAR